MKITHYAIDGNQCYFIYETTLGNQEVVAATNNGGLRDFLIATGSTGAIRVDNADELYKIAYTKAA